MNYILRGHDNRHAVEEMLFHLLPAEKLVHADDVPPRDEDYVISHVEVKENQVLVSAFCVYNNNSAQAQTEFKLDQPDDLEQKRQLTQAIKKTLYDAIVNFLSAPPSWGSLTGVRPAKFTRRFLEQGMTAVETDRILNEQYHVTKSRRTLAIRSAEVAIAAQKQLSDRDISLYIGIPFCPSRCSYCSFVSHTIERAGALIGPYLDVLVG